MATGLFRSAFRNTGPALAFLAAVLVAAALLLRPESETDQVSTSLRSALIVDSDGYRRPLGPIPFSFPADHGPHPGYKLEWWYFTGNLRSEAGTRLGYQLTFFRNALSPDERRNEADSASWRTNQLYLAHFAVTDVDRELFVASERSGRGAAGIAGAASPPLRVWLDDWSAEQINSGTFRIRLRANSEDAAIDLVLEPQKPLVLQGDQGFSRKGQEPGQASYYYSFTRMATSGTVEVHDKTYRVSGLSWLDREWSTFLLGETQVGWDWFSLQLDDGRDLMFFRLRESDPTTVPYADGLIVAPDGSTTPLEPDEVELTVDDTWTSPQSGATYPISWRMRIPRFWLDLSLSAYLDNQELNVSIRYWEGAINVNGTADGVPVSGSGYLEMTGYGDNPALRGGR